MRRPSKCNGAKLPVKYRVDIGNNAVRSGFETRGRSRTEDLLRAKQLRKAAEKYPDDIDRDAALQLAQKLEAAGNGNDVPDSLASSVYMREQRVNIVGALWQVVDNCPGRRVRCFTIVPKTWEFTAEQLTDVDPSQLLNALRTALYAKGADQATGWIYAYLHGEWDPIGKVFRLHVHGLAYGQMVKVIDGLRELPNYMTRRYLEDGSPSSVVRRIVMTREALSYLPRPITYVMQSYWPSRALIISDEGERMRARQKSRIGEPYHSQVLLWLDRWQISDLTLMIGLRRTNAGLIQTKPVS